MRLYLLMQFLAALVGDTLERCAPFSHSFNIRLYRPSMIYVHGRNCRNCRIPLSPEKCLNDFLCVIDRGFVNGSGLDVTSLDFVCGNYHCYGLRLFLGCNPLWFHPCRNLRPYWRMLRKCHDWCGCQQSRPVGIGMPGLWLSDLFCTWRQN